MNDTTTRSARLVMLPVADLDPNDWNPNFQTAEQFAENVAELRRIGRPHNPIIVRPRGQRYEIVNGEHTWLAAKETGLAKVPCEILDIDDFEARTQTIKRNQHGQNNPVRLGRLYAEMMQVGDLSIRALAKKIDVPESTIRTHLDFAAAAELRSSAHPSEPEKCVEEISSLSHTQAKLYRNLPGWRDLWFDNGADIEFLRSMCPDPANVAPGITSAGLEHLIDEKYFRASVQFAWGLAMKRTRLHRVGAIDKYIAPLTATRLGTVGLFPLPETLILLPCRICNSAVEVLIEPSKWARIIENAAARTSKPQRHYSLVQAAVLAHLRTAGVDAAEVYGSEVGEILSALDHAPDFIRTAEFLGLDEKAQLAAATADAPEEIVHRAREETVTRFRKLRTATDDSVSAGDDVLSNKSVVDIFNLFVKRLVCEQQLEAQDGLFANRDRVLDAVVRKLAADKTLDGARIGSRPAAEVLAERLQAMPPPEFVLLAAGVLGCAEPAQRWLAAMDGNEVSGKKPIRKPLRRAK